MLTFYPIQNQSKIGKKYLANFVSLKSSPLRAIQIKQFDYKNMYIPLSKNLGRKTLEIIQIVLIIHHSIYIITNLENQNDMS